MDGLKVIKDDSPPTRDNTSPLRLIGAEMPIDSVKPANDLNKEALATGSLLINIAYDSVQALKDGLFRYDASVSSG